MRKIGWLFVSTLDHRDRNRTRGRATCATSLARVSIPVASITSDGDRLNARPECARRFLALCGGPTRFVHARAADAGGRAPGHMTLVTTGACERAWAEAMRWIADATIGSGRPTPRPPP